MSATTNTVSEAPAAAPSATGVIDVGRDAGAILDLVADGVLVVETHGTVVFASRQVCELFGYQVMELVGRPVTMLVAPGATDDHEQLQVALALDAVAGPTACGIRLIGRRKDGRTVPVDLQISPMDGGLHVASVRPADEPATDEVHDRPHVAPTERDRHTRAVVDLVVQRLFAIAARLAGTTACLAGGDDALASSLELIDDTIELVRTEVLERYDRRDDVSGVQAELLSRRSARAS